MFDSHPPSVPVPSTAVRVGDWVKVGLRSERFWVRVVAPSRTKSGDNPSNDHQVSIASTITRIIDNALLQTVPPQLAKLGDRITPTDGCFLEVMTSVDEQAVHALAQQQQQLKTGGCGARTAYAAAATAYVARRPHVPR